MQKCSDVDVCSSASPWKIIFLFKTEQTEFSQVFISSEDVKRLKTHYEHLRKICFLIKFPILENKSSDNLPLGRAVTESELEAGGLLGKRHEAERASD